MEKKKRAVLSYSAEANEKIAKMTDEEYAKFEEAIKKILEEDDEDDEAEKQRELKRKKELEEVERFLCSRLQNGHVEIKPLVEIFASKDYSPEIKWR